MSSASEYLLMQQLGSARVRNLDSQEWRKFLRKSMCFEDTLADEDGNRTIVTLTKDGTLLHSSKPYLE